jgi:acetyl-CoA C-acetyltransferase
MIARNTPVIVGVGQSTDRIDGLSYKALSAPQLAATAALRAFDDVSSAVDIRPFIDVVATTRTFEDTGVSAAVFGKSNNFPRSVARLLGVDPRLAVWSEVGGNTPQDLVSEFCDRIGKGEFKLCLITGAEAISTVRHALAQGRVLDFTDNVDGPVDDRGLGLDEIRDDLTTRHRVTDAPVAYGLLENARRARLGLSRTDYARQMGALFEPFVFVARDNPNSAWAVPSFTARDLIEVQARNRWIADPYPVRLVARDQVNQGAAILIASAEFARELGIPVTKDVYLHGHSKATEKHILDRPDLGASPAAKLAAGAAIDRAEISVSDIRSFDFYSCFPIVVFNAAVDGLGLDSADPRGLTVTGGLPFFGGPGNNYAMHAIASTVERMRATPGAFGFVGANGGAMSKFSAGVYSTLPKAWVSSTDVDLQRELDAVAGPTITEAPQGSARIETYTVAYRKGEPDHAIVVGRSQNDARFIACSADGDRQTVAEMVERDPIGRAVVTQLGGDGLCRFAFDLKTPGQGLG